MKGLLLLALLGPLSVFGGATPAVASGFDWSTGQGLVEACKAVSIPQAKASELDVANVFLCNVQFQTWRDAWTFADAFNEHSFKRGGPICIPDQVTSKALIDGFMGWANRKMSSELKAQTSTASVYLFMRSSYPCK